MKCNIYYTVIHHVWDSLSIITLLQHNLRKKPHDYYKLLIKPLHKWLLVKLHHISASLQSERVIAGYWYQCCRVVWWGVTQQSWITSSQEGTAAICMLEIKDGVMSRRPLSLKPPSARTCLAHCEFTGTLQHDGCAGLVFREAVFTLVGFSSDVLVRDFVTSQVGWWPYWEISSRQEESMQFSKCFTCNEPFYVGSTYQAQITN